MNKFQEIQEQRESMRVQMTELSTDYLTFHDYRESEFNGVYDEFTF